MRRSLAFNQIPQLQYITFDELGLDAEVLSSVSASITCLSRLKHYNYSNFSILGDVLRALSSLETYVDLVPLPKTFPLQPKQGKSPPTAKHKVAQADSRRLI
jgi:hypothetical protein